MPLVKKAVKILDSYHVKYNYNLITNDEEFEKIRKVTSINSFPQIFINDEFVGRYSELADLTTNGNLVKLIN